ncbi:MAG TPA: hypothetical protein VHK89_05850 [Actinomycetota bacterium]|nr:hypothetical protein [Actinomycetota bacterium]
MARTNLHELANRLLGALAREAKGNTFEGKLRQIAADAGLNSVRSAEAIKLLEDLDRIEVVQRGRRGRNTVIVINSTDEITLSDAESSLPSRAGRRAAKLTYDDIGRSVVDRLLELARDDGLRAAQVEAFASESNAQRQRLEHAEQQLQDSRRRETDLRVKLKAAEEALERAEENLRRAMGPPRLAGEGPRQMEDADAKAVLDILRSGRGA